MVFPDCKCNRISSWGSLHKFFPERDIKQCEGLSAGPENYSKPTTLKFYLLGPFLLALDLAYPQC